MSNEEVQKIRGLVYGEFRNQAKISRDLQNAFFTNLAAKGPIQMEPYMMEALLMIFHKLARICNGDPRYIDSWRDVSSYAELVVKELEKTSGSMDNISIISVNDSGTWKPLGEINA